MAQDIIARLADGTELHFPEGTPDNVIDQAVQNYSVPATQPEQQPIQYSKLAESARSALGGLTLNWADEVEAALRTGSIKGKEYENLRDELRAKQDQFVKENPKTALATSVGGSLALPLGALGIGAKSMGLLKNIATGAALGGVQGLGGAKEGENLAGQTLKGAAFGGGVSGVLGTTAKVLAPELRQGARELQQQGIRLTPGQALGGATETLEQQAESTIPIVGSWIKGARTQSFGDFNRVAANRALKPIGQELPKGTVGFEAVNKVKEAIDNKYSEILPNLTFTNTPRFNKVLEGVTDRYSKGQLPKEQLSQLSNYVSNLQDAIGTGSISGNRVQALKQDLDDVVGAYKGATGSEKLLGDAYKQLQSSFFNTLKNQNPKYAQELKKVDESYANYLRINRAASKSNNVEGIFSPSQLSTASRELDQSLRKGATGRGKALMQDLSRQGYDVLGNKIPDSGTTGRALTSLLLTGAGTQIPLIGPAAIPAGLASTLYTTGGQKYLMPLITGARPQGVQLTSDVLRKTAPYLSTSLLDFTEE
jgi:hypothetical protein